MVKWTDKALDGTGAGKAEEKKTEGYPFSIPDRLRGAWERGRNDGTGTKGADRSPIVTWIRKTVREQLAARTKHIRIGGSSYPVYTETEERYQIIP